MSAAGVAGPVIAGVLVATAGAGWAIAIDAASFAVSALFLAGVRIVGRPRPGGSFAAELSEGWREVRARDWLWVTILAFAAFQVLVTADDSMPRDHAPVIESLGMTIATIDGRRPPAFARHQEQWEREVVHRWAHRMQEQPTATRVRYSLAAARRWTRRRR